MLMVRMIIMEHTTPCVDYRCLSTKGVYLISTGVSKNKDCRKYVLIGDPNFLGLQPDGPDLNIFLPVSSLTMRQFPIYNSVTHWMKKRRVLFIQATDYFLTILFVGVQNINPQVLFPG